jgi:CDGSH-type Zn-finger protein
MTTKITVRPDGSLRIEGDDFQICDGKGEVYDLNGRISISLCRCGASKNKPFCDGAHASCGFKSEVVATKLPPPAAKK